MANNCLVTKLKGVVDNDNLLKLGEIKLHSLIPLGTDRWRFSMTSTGGGTDCTARIINSSTAKFYNGEGVDQGQLVNNAGWNWKRTADHEYDIIISNKYALRFLFCACSVCDLKELDCCEYIEELGIDGKWSDAENLMKRIRVLQVAGSIANGLGNDLKSFKGNTTLEQLEIASSDTTGNIVENLSQSTELRIFWANGTNVTGELATLAANHVSAGRTSGSITISMNNYITFNGTTYSGHNIIIRFGSSMQNPTAEDTARGWQSVIQ